MLKELLTNGWAEIERLQQQLAILPEAETQIRHLLSGLLTSYYIFVGGLENLEANNNIEVLQKPTVHSTTMLNAKPITNLTAEPVSQAVIQTNQEDFEPFEYFVDFDAPTGQPITDEDLYG